MYSLTKCLHYFEAILACSWFCPVDLSKFVCSVARFVCCATRYSSGPPNPEGARPIYAWLLVFNYRSSAKVSIRYSLVKVFG